MAAPHVAGAAALLSGYWLKLSAYQLSNIMLATATDLGAKGVDNSYGRVMLNVEAALKPVGNFRLNALGFPANPAKGRVGAVAPRSMFGQVDSVAGVTGLAPNPPKPTGEEPEMKRAGKKAGSEKF